MTTAQLSALRAYFTNKGILQTTIAKQTNVTPARVSQLLSGKRAFGKSTAHQWQTLFGISASWLLTGDGEMLLGEISPGAFLRELEAQRKQIETLIGIVESQQKTLANYQLHDKNSIR